MPTVVMTEGKLRPVAYLAPAERNYDAFNKELLAVIRALKEWHHLLEGSGLPIQILRDH
jgi:hypothetical protein